MRKVVGVVEGSLECARKKATECLIHSTKIAFPAFARISSPPLSLP